MHIEIIIIIIIVIVTPIGIVIVVFIQWNLLKLHFLNFLAKHDYQFLFGN